MKQIAVITFSIFTLSVSANVANSDGIPVFPAENNMVKCTDYHWNGAGDRARYKVTCGYDPLATTAETDSDVMQIHLTESHNRLTPKAIANLEEKKYIVYTASETDTRIDALRSSVVSVESKLTKHIEARIDDVFGEFSSGVLERVITEEAVSAMKSELAAQLSSEISSLLALEIEASKTEFLQSDEFKNAVREAIN